MPVTSEEDIKYGGLQCGEFYFKQSHIMKEDFVNQITVIVFFLRIIHNRYVYYVFKTQIYLLHEQYFWNNNSGDVNTLIFYKCSFRH